MTEGYASVPVDRAIRAVENYKFYFDKKQRMWGNLKEELKKEFIGKWVFKESKYEYYMKKVRWDRALPFVVSTEHPDKLSKKEAMFLCNIELYRLYEQLRDITNVHDKDHVLVGTRLSRFIYDWANDKVFTPRM